MENIITSIKTLFATYGFRAATIVIATVILVNLIKKPILSRADKLQKLKGLEKSVLTRYVSFLPMIVAFLIDFVWECVAKDFAVAEFDYGSLASSAVLYGALAVATYETVKKQLQAYAAKSVKSASDKKDKPTESNADSASALTDEVSSDVTATDAAKKNTDMIPKGRL